MPCTSGCFELPCPPTCPPTCNCTTNDIKYNGVNDTCTGVTYGSFLTEVLTKLATFAKNRLYSIVPSSTIAVTAVPSTCNKSASLAVKVSADVNNVVEVHSDGLYVAAASDATVSVTDTNSIDLTLIGTNIRGDVKLSATAGNRLSIQSDGLLSAQYTADQGVNKNTANNFRLVEIQDGAATKFLWNYGKGAFRAGTVTGTRWDNANIGSYSAAFGLDNICTATATFAAGNNNTVISDYSAAFGTNNFVESTSSAAFGSSIIIYPLSAGSFAAGSSLASSQPYSAVFGRSSAAAGVTPLGVAQGGSFVAGLGNHVSGEASFALGENNTTNADFDGALGTGNSISGNYSYGLGKNLIGTLSNHVILGLYNDNTDTAADTVEPTATNPNPAISFGVGYSTGVIPFEVLIKQNGLTLYKNFTAKFYGAIDQRTSIRGFLSAQWTTVNRPSIPIEGEQGYNLTTHHMEYWNGTTWVSL